jgi:hypothetical protein
MSIRPAISLDDQGRHGSRIVIILTIDPVSQSGPSYFFKARGGAGWRSTAGTTANQGSVTIDGSQAFLSIRKSGTGGPPLPASSA